MERKQLDNAEEIEKVEIDLRRCASQRAMRRKSRILPSVFCVTAKRSELGYAEAEHEIVKNKLEDVQHTWKTEWDGFRIVSHAF